MERSPGESGVGFSLRILNWTCCDTGDSKASRILVNPIDPFVSATVLITASKVDTNSALLVIGVLLRKSFSRKWIVRWRVLATFREHSAMGPNNKLLD